MRAASAVPVRRAFLVVAAMVVAAACGANVDSPVVGEQAVNYDAKVAVDEVATASRERASGLAMARLAPPASVQPTIPRPMADSMITSMLIRRGDVSVRVDSIEPAMAAVRALAARLGGTVGNVSITAGDYTVRSATLEMRVPAPRFDDAMGGLTPIGKVEQSNVTAEDVGEEYVDVRARVSNARRLEARLVDILATRTGKLVDVLAVERELARVREEIERHEGRMRWMKAHAATSTISVTVTEKAPVVGATPGRSVLGAAFVQAWRNFVGLIAWSIASLGTVIPIAAVAFLLLRGWQRRRQRGSMEA